jgi:hypothetical protein
MTKQEHEEALRLIRHIEELQNEISEIEQHKINGTKPSVYYFNPDFLPVEILDLYTFNVHSKILQTQEELRQLEQQTEA